MIRRLSGDVLAVAAALAAPFAALAAAQWFMSTVDAALTAFVRWAQ